MYASASEQTTVEQAKVPSKLPIEIVRSTWWNRSVGPFMLTTALAPLVLAVMGAGGLLLWATGTAVSVTTHTLKCSTNRSSTWAD